MTIYGVDIHPRFQSGISIEEIRREGFDFMAVKVSDGTVPGGRVGELPSEGHRRRAALPGRSWRLSSGPASTGCTWSSGIPHHGRWWRASSSAASPSIAYKGKQGQCGDHGQAVIYRGPFKAVLDDDEHVFTRGVPTVVCAKSFEIYSWEPYTGQFHLLESADPATAPLFDCAPPGVLTRTGPRGGGRPVSGMTSGGRDPTTGCC